MVHLPAVLPYHWDLRQTKRFETVSLCLPSVSISPISGCTVPTSYLSPSNISFCSVPSCMAEFLAHFPGFNSSVRNRSLLAVRDRPLGSCSNPGMEYTYLVWSVSVSFAIWFQSYRSWFFPLSSCPTGSACLVVGEWLWRRLILLLAFLRSISTILCTSPCVQSHFDFERTTIRTVREE